MSAASSNQSAVTRATCPYCALLCDDLSVQPRDGCFQIVRNGCQRAKTDFARSPIATKPMVKGKRASVSGACVRGAEILARARQPLLAGLGTDVDGMRAAIELAESVNGIVDHMHGDALAAMSAVMQSRGWYATTLSEVRNRADLVIIVDLDLADRYENFARQCLKPRARPGRKAARERRVGYIGRPERTAKPAEPGLQLKCQPDNVHQTLRTLLGALKYPKQRRTRTTKPLEALVDAMNAADYTVFVFSAGALEAPQVPCIATVCEIVDQLNTENRAAILSLGGDDGGQTAAAVSAWLTGYPLRVSFGQRIEYGPKHNQTQHLIEQDAVDALLWIDAFGRNPTPPAFPPEKTIVVAATEPQEVERYAAFIPVGTPGVDHFARLVRTDSVATLALPQLRRNRLANVADILRAMTEALS